MSRVILNVIVATITFIVGIAVNWSVNTFGGLAVDRVYSDAAVNLKISIILPDEVTTALPVNRCPLVVSVSADLALYLNSMPMGTLSDTSALSVTLRTLLERREELRVYVPAPDLSSRVPGYPRIDKTVYIKAPRSLSYREVADLIAMIKEAGADPVGLIAERHQP